MLDFEDDEDLDSLLAPSGRARFGAYDRVGRPGLRAGLYERVSILPKRASKRLRQRVASIEQQNRENVQACETYQWQVVARYQDPGISASRFTDQVRPDHMRLLADVEAGDLDVVAFWEVSRGDRKLAIWAAFLDTCRDRNIRIYVTSHDYLYDLRILRDWRAMADEGVSAHEESEKISLRVNRSVRDAIREGRPLGQAPYGYERIYHSRTKELVRQQPQALSAADLAAGRPGPAEVVRRIIAAVARNYPLSAIARELNRLGIPSPGGGLWLPATIRKIALNISYIGKRRWKGEIVDAMWPPLVKEPVFWAAVNVLTGRMSGPGETKPGKMKYLLSYYANCGECAGLMFGTPQGDGRPHVYECVKGCTAILLEQTDRYVELAVFERLSRPDFYSLSLGADDKQTVELRAEAGQMRARLAEFTASAAAGQITPAGFARIERQILAKIAGVEQRITALAVPLPLRELAGRPAGEIEVKWRELAPPARRAICDAIFESVTINADPAPDPQPWWDQARGRWVVSLERDGKRQFHGRFTERADADAAMAKALREAGPRRKRLGKRAFKRSRVVLRPRQPQHN